MINIKQQEEILIALGNILEKKIVVYAIGGTAMMLRGIKDSTLDIDLVFDKKDDRDKFIFALKQLGAKDFDVTIVYGLKNNIPIMLKLGDARFDLFMNKIITSTFSDKMKERANQNHEFGKNLIIKAANSHDIIIMKCVTSRTKDLEDISVIMQNNDINWDIITDEAQQQVNLGNENAIVSIGEKLEKLNNKKIIEVPKQILDKLWVMLKEQSKKKSKKINLK
ncbi:MAG: DUF6036 family nucleotidyltransferase [Nanoarchaeota archaeon]